MGYVLLEEKKIRLFFAIIKHEAERIKLQT